ncbi:MAG: TauD/TfdA family dioxygenase [Pseudomonadota bacterium]
MNAPLVQIPALPTTGQAEVIAALDTVAGEIAQALKAPPYYTLLRGASATEDRRLTVHFARTLANMEPVRPDSTPESRQKISFTQVRIDPEKAAGNAGSTSYSRTNKPLELHTDSSYKRDPHELVAFQMVRADMEGGDTIMMPVDRILNALAPEIRAVLSRPAFPFGKGPLPILWETDGVTRIRYYRSQIDLSGGIDLPGEEKDAMAVLDEVIGREDLQDRFRIEPGDTLYMDNTRVLHGRTGFAPTSNRLMYRIRSHVGCLG